MKVLGKSKVSRLECKDVGYGYRRYPHTDSGNSGNYQEKKSTVIIPSL